MATTHTVSQGECLSSIARQYGFANWRTIYEHPRNADFRRRRPNPNLIYPGDQLTIPDKAPKKESCQTGSTHAFRLHAQHTLLRIVVQDAARQPLRGAAYRLRIGETVLQGTTDGEGLIAQPISPGVVDGELAVRLGEEPGDGEYVWAVKIGHLDPADEISGVQARLNNLGFDCGPVDGINGPNTEAAVRSFQRKHGLTVDGIAGPQTQSKLQEVYGC
jgi:N-acetylmuramoyl-L-alanine amidase